MKKMLFMCAVALAGGSLLALDLVKEGAPLAEIVVAEDAHNGVRLAAKDLQDYIAQMSGARLEIVTAPSGTKKRIFVGESAFTRALGYRLPDFRNSGLDILVTDDYAVLAGPSTFYALKPKYSKENIEEFWSLMGEKYRLGNFNTSGTANHKLKICVNDDIGAWHAVSEFLETLGVRFYAPYRDGTIVPQMKNVSFKPGRITKEAAYGRREYTYYGSMRTDAEGISWLKRMKCGNRSAIVYNHTTRDLISNPETRKRHPNWYAEETPGKLYAGSHGQGGVPRFTDPDFQRACIDWADKLFDANPTLSAVSLGAPDGGNPWDWRDQKRYLKPGMTGRQGYADMMWDFHKVIARGIKAKHPDKYLIWWCQYNDSVPTNIDPKDIPDNLLVPGHAVGPHHLVIESTFRNKLESEKRLRAAFHCTARTPSWEWWLAYARPATPRYPVFYMSTLQRWRQAKRDIADGVFMELSPAWQASGTKGEAGDRIAEVPLVHLMLYVNNKLLWNPDLDLNALLEEYYRLWFGPAAAEMKAFHVFAEAVWSRDESRSVTETAGFLKEKDVGEYFALLAKAKAKTAPGTVYFRRIEDLEKGYASLKDLFASLKRIGPEIELPVVPNETAVDGNLAKYKDGWRRMGTSRTGEIPVSNVTETVTSLSADHKKLFVAVRCWEDRMDQIVARCAAEDDRGIFDDDLVEIYLDTPVRSYFKVCVNPNGAVWDETTDITIINRDSMGILWNPGTKAVVRRYPDRWEVEVMIPTDDFGTEGPTREKPWGLNVCRTRVSALGFDKQAGFSLAPTGQGGYRNQKCWAKAHVAPARRTVEIPYRQLTPEKALETYCDWIVSQLPKFDKPPFEWYFLFYPMRTLLMGANLLNRPDYAEAVWPYMDRYVEEQLPNGALTSNCRGQPGATMTQQDIEDLLSTGKLNLADNGSNVHGLLLGAVTAKDPARRARYIAAAKKWLDCWVPIWRLPSGAYGNGIWCGHKLNGPYSMAMNVCSALAAFTLITGDEHYIHNAEKFAMFQCDNWHKLGVPIRFDLYPTPNADSFCGDFARVYYLFEALAWTHYVSRDPKVRARIAERLKQWIDADLILRWPADRDWFDMNKSRCQVYDEKFRDSGEGVRFYWQACKAAGMSGLLSYYVNCIEDRADLRDRVNRGGLYLSNPLKARMLAVMADDVEPKFCMQATGFGGLGVAEAFKPRSTFEVYNIRKIPQP